MLKCQNPCEWVAENVIPVLNRSAVSKYTFTESLKKYLSQFDSINIIADWPEDIERFCRALITSPGQCIQTPPLSMSIVRIDAESELPHNALEDARGTRKAIREATNA